MLFHNWSVAKSTNVSAVIACGMCSIRPGFTRAFQLFRITG